MGEGEESVSDSEGFQDLLCLSVNRERGPSDGIVPNLNIDPPYFISQAPANRLQKGLFCGKSDRITLGRPRSPLAPKNLLPGEDPAEKVVPPPFHNLLNPLNVHDVNADPNNHFPKWPVPGYGLRVAR